MPRNSALLKSGLNPLTGRVARNLDESGNVQSWQGTEGRVVSYERDAAGRMTKQTDSEGVVTEYQYDSAGRVATIAHPSSGARHLERDRAGRVTKVTDALDHETTYGYYPDGKLAWQKDHLQREWRYAYGTNWIEVTDPCRGPREPNWVPRAR